MRVTLRGISIWFAKFPFIAKYVDLFTGFEFADSNSISNHAARFLISTRESRSQPANASDFTVRKLEGIII